MAGSSPLRTKAFVSYSHTDARYLKRLRIHLIPYVREQDVEVWDDTHIALGARWEAEIKRAIASAKVAVLLVSADFLASEFIMHKELPPLLQAAGQQRLRIFQVILSPCAFRYTRLADYQALNKESEPLINMARGRQEAIWAKLAKDIADALVPGQSAGVPAHVTQVYNSLLDLPKEQLRSLLTFLTMGQPGKHAANSTRALLQEIIEIAKGDTKIVDKVRQFAESFGLVDVLAHLSEKPFSEAPSGHQQEAGGGFDANTDTNADVQQ